MQLPTVWSIIAIVAAALLRPTVATVHLPIVRHHLLANRLRVVEHLWCDVRSPADVMRLCHTLGVSAGAADLHGIGRPDRLHRHFYMHNHQVGVVLDLTGCPERQVRALLHAASAHTLFHRRYVWLMFADGVSRIYDLLEDENVNVDADITVAVPATLSTVVGEVQWDLWDVYNPSHVRGGRLNVTLLQRWRAGTEPRWPVDMQSKYERRKDFHGLKLKGVLTIADVPANHSLQSALDSTASAHLDSMNRLNYRLFRMLEAVHNFRIFLVRSRYWGFLVNGSWIGAIGFTVRNEVDICMTALRWSPERFGFYETTTYTYHVRVLFLFRHPRAAIASADVFVHPFRPAVWFATLLIGLFAAWLLRHIVRLDDASAATHTTDESTWSAALLTVAGIFFQQAYDAEPQRFSARCTAATTLLFALLLYQFYGSFIVGSLLIEPPRTIRTIQQLLDSRLQCAIDEVSYVRDIFNHAIDPVAIRLYREKILQPNNVVRLDRGLALVKRGGWAFHTDVSSTYIRLQRVLSDAERCDLQEIAYAKPFACGPALPTGSPLQELVKIGIRRLFESGLHAYHSAVWEQRKPKCSKAQVEVAPIDLEHFQSALLMLAAGATAAVAIFIGECIVSRRLHRRRRQQRPLQLPFLH